LKLEVSIRLLISNGLCCCLLGCLASSATAQQTWHGGPGQPTLANPKRVETTPATAAEPKPNQELNLLITALELKNLPHSYTRDKDWGQQSERWDGIKWKREGLKIRTKRRKKKVNHGTWKKYSASLVDPKRQFKITMTDVGQTTDQKMKFRLSFLADLTLHARQAEWVKGVQIYSLSADGKASVRLSVDMVLGMKLDAARFPPDLIFLPEARSATIIVDDFRIDRVSKLGGEFAQQVTRLARREMDQEVAEKELELVEKINKEIAENRDDLRLSLAEALKSQWADRAKPFLPNAVKQAIERSESKAETESSDK